MRQWLSGWKASTAAGKGEANSSQPSTAESSTGTTPRQLDAVIGHLLHNVRNKHVRQHFLEIPSSEYTESKKLYVLAGTYNLNGKKPVAGIDLAEWLGSLKQDWPAGCAGPDVVAIGFQEIIPLSAGNVIGGGTTEGVEAWDQLLAAALNGQEWAARHFRRSTSSIVVPEAEAEGGSSTYTHGQATPQSFVGAGYQMITEQASGIIDGVNKMWSGGPRATATSDLLHFLAVESGGLGSDQQQLQGREGNTDGDSIAPEVRRDDFIQLTAKQLVGVYLSVWVRKGLLRHVSGVQTTSVATGFGGLLGNKGAVAARMRLYDSPVCFVASHFQSGDGEGDEQKRNADYADIIRRAAFPPEGDLSSKSATDALFLLSVALGPGHWGERRSILDHDNVIWVGDLNYRLVMADDEVRRHLRFQRLAPLLEADQLTRELAAGRVFQGWKEAPITFMPTFKYLLGTQVYVGDPLPSNLSLQAGALGLADLDAESDADGLNTPPPESISSGVSSSEPSTATGGSQKRRTPAWCDRVLWLAKSELQHLGYRRGELTASDHRPVAASFALTARHYRRDRVEALVDEARRKVDLSEMARRPKCTVEPNLVPLGEVCMYERRVLSVTLANTGAVDAYFHFVPLPVPASPGGSHHRSSAPLLAPRWLSISPQEGQVAAGEEGQIQLTVEVRGGPEGSADMLAHQPGCAMDAILILRVEDGMDHFISVTGQLRPSAFGLALTNLADYRDSPIVPPQKSADQPAGGVPEGPGGAGGESQAQPDTQTETGDAGPSAEAVAAAVAARKDSMTDALLAFAAAADVPAGDLPLPADRPQLTRGPSSGDRLVPKELRALTDYLLEDERLATPGLFVKSVDVVTWLTEPSEGSSQVTPSRSTRERVLDVTADLRASLDAGHGVPEGTSAHVVAAALLLLFQELPSPLLPAAAAEAAVCGEALVPGAVLDLLARHMPPADFAVLHHMLAFVRRALHSQMTSRNDLKALSVAALLADHWFLPLPPGMAKLAEANAIVAGRVAFVQALIEGPDASTVLELTPSKSVDLLL